jgi:hypothetical protein
MLLRWKKDNLKVINLIPTSKEAKKIQLKKATLVLLPGINEISDNAYSVAKPHIEDSLNGGSLEELHEKSKKESQKEATSIIDVSTKRASELIAETNNPETLYLWLRIENRDSLRNQVRDRIKELQLTEKPPEGMIIDYPETGETAEQNEEETLGNGGNE